jgi:hypothetical protein
MTNRYYMIPDHGPGVLAWGEAALLIVAWNGTGETWTLPYEVVP